MRPQAMVEVRDLTKRYGETAAVDGISFSVEQGEIVGFLGPNGAGKTTTMRILSCYLPATSGTARVAGYDTFTQSIDVRRNLGYLPENYPFYPEMRVAEYIDYRAHLKGLHARGVRRRRLAEVMELCWITDVQRKPIGNLSKGYRQRVALAEALLANPPLLVLDEPTVGLDPNQIRQARQLIKDLARKHTVILSTHILPEVEMICDRVIIINKGRIVADDTLKNLQRKAREEGGLVVETKASAPPEEIQKALSGIPGVRKVWKIREGETASFRVEIDSQGDPREAIWTLMSERRWPVLELKRDAMRLEDIFVKLVLETDTAA